MGKKIIVIAPHGNEELVKRCQSNIKSIVYLPNDRARLAVSQGGTRYESVFVNHREHDDACFNGHEMELAKQVVDASEDLLKRGAPTVYVLIPEDLVGALEFQIVIKGKAFLEEFDVILQQFGDEYEVDSEHIFRIIERKISARYSQFELAPYEGYYKPVRRPEKSAEKKDEVLTKPKTPPFNLAATYASIASGNLDVLENLEVNDLRKLIDECIDRSRFDLVKCIDAIVEKKQKKSA